MNSLCLAFRTTVSNPRARPARPQGMDWLVDTAHAILPAAALEKRECHLYFLVVDDLRPVYLGLECAPKDNTRKVEPLPLRHPMETPGAHFLLRFLPSVAAVSPEDAGLRAVTVAILDRCLTMSLKQSATEANHVGR